MKEESHLVYIQTCTYSLKPILYFTLYLKFVYGEEQLSIVIYI